MSWWNTVDGRARRGTGLQFFAGKPCWGIEITSSAIRLAVVSRRGDNLAVLYSKTTELPAGMVSDAYLSLNISDGSRLGAALRECLTGASLTGIRRAALSLPDGVFRIQMLEFDELPKKPEEQEQLIRWKFEKAAFDITDTVLRYQILPRQDKGKAVLVCVAKQAVIAQYEAVLIGLGLEPWSVGPSSFHTLNFYSPFITRRSSVSALVHIAEDSFSTIILEAGVARFYRYKEIKRGSADETKSRITRDIDDSLHFYAHLDREQTSDVKDLYLTGESSLPVELAQALMSMTSLNVEVLSPSVVIPAATGAGREMAASLGAGGAL